MMLHEVVKSGRQFRRSCWQHPVSSLHCDHDKVIVNQDGDPRQITQEDLLATDWEIGGEKRAHTFQEIMLAFQNAIACSNTEEQFKEVLEISLGYADDPKALAIQNGEVIEEEPFTDW